MNKITRKKWMALRTYRSTVRMARVQVGELHKTREKAREALRIDKKRFPWLYKGPVTGSVVRVTETITWD